MRRIMILGANGFLGSSLLNKLQLDNNNCITTFCRSKSQSNIGAAFEINDDLRNLYLYTKQIRQQDYIFYMAGSSGAALSSNKGPEFIINNEVNLLSLLDILKNSPNPPGILFPSSRLVYEASQNRVSEEGCLCPNSIYGLSKLHSENLLALYQRQYNIPFIVFRISIPFGFTNVLHNGYGIVNHFIRQSVSDESIKIFGKGDQKRDIIYISDLNEVFCRSMNEFDIMKNNVFNCGGLNIYSLSDIAYTVVDRFKSGSVQHVEWPDEYKKVETGDINLNSDKLYSQLGFTPQFDLDGALSDIKSIMSL